MLKGLAGCECVDSVASGLRLRLLSRSYLGSLGRRSCVVHLLLVLLSVVVVHDGVARAYRLSHDCITCGRGKSLCK